MSDSNDELLSYIKDSVDRLHDKVDVIHEDADTRLKALEVAQAKEIGAAAATSKFASIIWGVLGGLGSSAVSWAIFRR